MLKWGTDTVHGHLGLTLPVTGRRSSKVEMIGARYAKVLPLPVSAASTTSCPRDMAGMANSCIPCMLSASQCLTQEIEQLSAEAILYTPAELKGTSSCHVWGGLYKSKINSKGTSITATRVADSPDLSGNLLK